MHRLSEADDELLKIFRCRSRPSNISSRRLSSLRVLIFNGSFGKFESAEKIFSGSYIEVIGAAASHAASDIFSFLKNWQRESYFNISIRRIELPSASDVKSDHTFFTL